MLPALLFLASALTFSAPAVEEAFHGHPGAFVLIDCANGDTFRSDPTACAEKLAPCSTFKIWNTAIGLELGLIPGADEPFWKWDGKKRTYDAWNKDQTLRTAFTASCVPAYQHLARRIGPERMQSWLDKLEYGDRNISCGIDIFWLPDPGRKTLLITPDAQAEMIVRLVQGKPSFSARTLAVLKDVMQVKKTAKGTLYGKTGSSLMKAGENYGWFVGYVESNGKTHAFACVLKGKTITGKNARNAVESLLASEKLL